jgi:membrane protease YdiL (CAAX protease family)
MVASRTVFALLAQAAVALLFLVRGTRHPWSASVPWWSVYGTLVDIGCLVLLGRFTRREGRRIRDLIGFDKSRWFKDLLIGLGYFLLVFPLMMMGGTMLSSLVVYGTTQPPMYPGMLVARMLPSWAVVYSLSAWWVVWSVTEETTYEAYSFIRFERLTRRRWVAIAIVGFWWALQHSFFPLIPDWRYIVWRFIAFLPGVVTAAVIYSRTRRLPPMIAMHWPMDIVAASMTLAR